MSDELVLLKRAEENENIAILTLNRLTAGNVINTTLLKDLSVKLDEIEADSSIRVVIMRSVGYHASYGAELKELVIKHKENYSQITKNKAIKHIGDGRAVVKKMFNLRVPIIGIIWGFCLGGGAELYTFCDVLYAAKGRIEDDGLLYGFPEPTIGVMAGWMGPEMLIRKIGSGFANDILFTGRMINANEAHSMGIVQKVFPKYDLVHRATEWAEKVAANAPLAVESTRRITNRVLFPDFDEVCDSTGSETVDNLMTGDFIKGAKKILTDSEEQPDFGRM